MASALQCQKGHVFCQCKDNQLDYICISPIDSMSHENNKNKVFENIREKLKTISDEIVEIEFNDNSELVIYCKDTLLDGRKLILFFQTDNPFDVKDDEKEAILFFTKFVKNYIDTWEKNKIQQERKREFNLYQKVYAEARESNKERFLKRAADIICAELSVDWCHVYFKDPISNFIYYPNNPTEDVYYLTVTSGEIDKKELDKTEYKKEEGITGSVANKNTIVIEQNVQKSTSYSGFNKSPLKARGIDCTSYLGVPIRKISNTDLRKIEVCGILSAGRKRKTNQDNRIFTQEEGFILDKVAAIIGKEIQLREGLYTDEHYKCYIELLQEITMRFNDCRSEENIYEIFGELLEKHLKEEFYSIFKLNEDGVLTMEAPSKYKRKNPPSFMIGSGLTGKVIDDKIPSELQGSAIPIGQGKGHIIYTLNLSEGKPDCKEFWRKIIKTQERYFMGVPIIHPSGNGFYGVLTLNGQRPKHFNPEFYKNVTTKVMMSISSLLTLSLRQISRGSN